MADDFYGEMGDMATELLTEFNQAEYMLKRAGLVIPGPNEWDAPTRLPPQTWTLQGISSKVDIQYVGRASLTGSVIVASDRQLLVDAFEDEPKPGDVLTVNGKVQTVLGIFPVTEKKLAWHIVVKG